MGFFSSKERHQMAISPLPTPPSTSNPATFAAQGDALLSALPTFVTEANALEVNVNAKEVSVNSSASTATTQAGLAIIAKDTAVAAKDIAVASASAASASATSALGYLNTMRATSYGAYASDPALDPLGNAPTVGDEYFNTTSNLMKHFNGSIWVASDINTGDLAAPTGSSLVGHIASGTNTTTRTVQSILRDNLNISDYTSTANALANMSSIASLIVPLAVAVTPISASGKNILYDYDQGGNSANVLKTDGTRGGYFANYDCKANKVYIAQITENQSGIAGGGFRDVVFYNAVDSDVVDYTAIGQKVTNAIRGYVNGAHNGTAYQSQYKDLVGGAFAAVGNIQWAARGVSGVTCDAIQYGIGIASNEFSVENPSSANGSASQSLSMAAVQAIVRSRYADEDGSHVSRGVYISNNGSRITHGVQLISDTTGGFTSHFKYGIYMGTATVSAAAIVMPASASGNSGTIIEYDTNDYTLYDRANNKYVWVVGGAIPFGVTANGISVGSSTLATTRLFIEPSTTALSSMRVYQGVAPTSPSDGDLWYDGTNLKFRIGAVTKTFTLV